MLLGLALLATGCAGASTRPTEVGPSPFVLYPMTEGNVWSYDIVDDQGQRSLGITRVERRAGELVEVRSNGGEPVLYRLRDQGIELPSEAAWLLRAPIVVGEEWPARSGRVARVASTDEAVTTPAGDFTDCVRIEERGGRGELAIDTTFCPGVGPVHVVVTLNAGGTGPRARTEARLLGMRLVDETAGP